MPADIAPRPLGSKIALAENRGVATQLRGPASPQGGRETRSGCVTRRKVIWCGAGQPASLPMAFREPVPFLRWAGRLSRGCSLGGGEGSAAAGTGEMAIWTWTWVGGRESRRCHHVRHHGVFLKRWVFERRDGAGGNGHFGTTSPYDSLTLLQPRLRSQAAPEWQWMWPAAVSQGGASMASCYLRSLVQKGAHWG